LEYFDIFKCVKNAFQIKRAYPKSQKLALSPFELMHELSPEVLFWPRPYLYLLSCAYTETVV
jgi:hypothetical protein